ncbi:MAG: FHA domain-containing protein [Planctomycetota bacterium]|nr:FHA domain-containing protein [Planctomycetota bacterium]MDA1158467.1 FHA domain-containing protein [Planctomycetota bacterium]
MEATTYTCRIVVTTGPDRGKVFEVDEELIHIGRADENQIVLDDPSLPDHQASILRKNGRFAIFRPTDAEVQVDGADIPAEKWVWLPNDVRLQFGRRTSCQLTYEMSLDNEPASSPKPAAAKAATSKSKLRPVAVPQAGNVSTNSGHDSGDAGNDASNDLEDGGEHSVDQSSEGASAAESGPKKRSRKKGKSAKRQKNVARFITDQGGPLVELGADGHLPELALQDDPTRKEKQAKPKQSNSALLYSVLGLSFLSSLAMLFAEVDPPSVSELSKGDARQEIVRFFGSDDKELETWQKQLRAARLAHSRGDAENELMAYRRVLTLLKSEDRDPHVGITGHLSTDEELKRLIGIIISR